MYYITVQNNGGVQDICRHKLNIMYYSVPSPNVLCFSLRLHEWVIFLPRRTSRGSQYPRFHSRPAHRLQWVWSHLGFLANYEVSVLLVTPRINFFLSHSTFCMGYISVNQCFISQANNFAHLLLNGYINWN